MILSAPGALEAMFSAGIAPLWDNLARPLLRLACALCAGLLAANLVEALGWTRALAAFCSPLARLARLGEAAAASFALAFVSPSAANALLAERRDQGALTLRELVLANLFNSLPAYMVHAPTMLFMLWPVLGRPALVYVGLTLAAAAGRTLLTLLWGRMLLPKRPPEGARDLTQDPAPALAPDQGSSDRPRRVPPAPGGLAGAFGKAWARFRRRAPRLLLFSVPIYLLMCLLRHAGAFAAAQSWLAAHLPWAGLLKPEALSIVVLSLAAEIGAPVAAAGSALDMGDLAAAEVVLALLIGNIVSTPMRALRHQFPAYAGYYRPALALKLLLANQALRTASLIAAAWLYWGFTSS